VGQFGTTILLGFQVIATEFSALSRKFFTIFYTSQKITRHDANFVICPMSQIGQIGQIENCEAIY
jgi:hypothetical protein